MQCYWRHSWVKWLLIILLIPLGIQAYAEFFPDQNAPPVTLQSVFFDFLPGVIFLIFMGLLVKFAGQIYFRRTAYCNQEMTFTLREVGVHVVSPLSESEMKWPIYARATENAQGFALFHQGKRLFNWFPKSGFDSPESINQCRELFRKNVKDSRRLFAS
jgi:hypothetical protein